METISPMLEQKKKLVTTLSHKMKTVKTVLIASTKNLPSSQFQAIKKNLRGKAEIMVIKKSIMIRAIAATEKGALQKLKEYITSDIAIFFSDIESFDLSALLSENQNPSKAKEGDLAPEDIVIEAGATELLPGPAISELSGVGLKVSVEGGKLAIKQTTTVVKKGHPIKANVVSVLAKLNILPMSVGFIPIAAYDRLSEKLYVGIKIDKHKALEELRELIAKALNFAINIGDINEKTIGHFIGKAGMQEKAIENLIKSKGEVKNE